MVIYQLQVVNSRKNIEILRQCNNQFEMIGILEIEYKEKRQNKTYVLLKFIVKVQQIHLHILPHHIHLLFRAGHEHGEAGRIEIELHIIAEIR